MSTFCIHVLFNCQWSSSSMSAPTSQLITNLILWLAPERAALSIPSCTSERSTVAISCCTSVRSTVSVSSGTAIRSTRSSTSAAAKRVAIGYRWARSQQNKRKKRQHRSCRSRNHFDNFSRCLGWNATFCLFIASVSDDQTFSRGFFKLKGRNPRFTGQNKVAMEIFRVVYVVVTFELSNKICELISVNKNNSKCSGESARLAISTMSTQAWWKASRWCWTFYFMAWAIRDLFWRQLLKPRPMFSSIFSSSKDVQSLLRGICCSWWFLLRAKKFSPSTRRRSCLWICSATFCCTLRRAHTWMRKAKFSSKWWLTLSLVQKLCQCSTWAFWSTRSEISWR